MKATMTMKNGEWKTGEEWYEEVFAPTTFDIVGVEVSNAKITPEKALEIALSTTAAQYLTMKQKVKEAASNVVYDHIIRTSGKEMESKFDGSDAITGQTFAAGTKIIFFGGGRVDNRHVAKGAVIA